MIVLNLSCANQHRFEGWFASGDEFSRQLSEGAVTCPVCGDHEIARLPSNPRVKRGSSAGAGERKEGDATAAPQPAGMQAMLKLMQQALDQADDVGEDFAEEARRIHYSEVPARSIRGLATRDQAVELLDEGITVVPLRIPPARKMH
jgi:hypothetical protein